MTTQTRDETELWRAALATAGLTNDDIRDVAVTRDEGGRVSFWSVMLMTGIRYRLTPAGELVSY
jgi:hypothetical protein